MNIVPTPLDTQQFFHEFEYRFIFGIAQVAVLTNNEYVKRVTLLKQILEELNHIYKASNQLMNAPITSNGTNHYLHLWISYYNFLRHYKHNKYKVLNETKTLKNTNNMPNKCQFLISLHS